MVQILVNLDEHENRFLNIAKGVYGLNNKAVTINLIIREFEEKLFEPQLKSEFVKKIKALEKRGKTNEYGDFGEFRKKMEKS